MHALTKSRAFVILVTLLVDMENMQDITNYKIEIEKNGVIAFVPKGNSMWPILKNKGQSVIIRKKTAEEIIEPFAVIFYERENGSLVLHRVLELRNNSYIVCGDSQFELEKVYERQVFGVMEGFYNRKKYIKATDPTYLKKVRNWYKRKTLRKIRINCFNFKNRVISKLKRIVKKIFREEKNNV